jgi:hypothetical protein
MDAAPELKDGPHVKLRNEAKCGPLVILRNEAKPETALNTDASYIYYGRLGQIDMVYLAENRRKTVL